MSSPLLLLKSGRNKPTIDWSFLTALPAGLTFTNASTIGRSYFDASGVMQFAVTNQPRFDYDPATRAPLGLLMEEQRTNLIASSNVFGASSSSVVTPASGTGLTGANDLVLIEEGLTTAAHLVASAGGAVSFTSGTVYTYSAYVKAGSETVVQLGYSTTAFAATAYANFDLSNGTVSYSGAGLSSPASIVNVGGGVYRISICAAANATALGSGGILSFTDSNPTAARFPSYLGTGKSFYVQRAQTEAGAFASSFIPTSGAAATRAADCLSTTSIPWFNAAAFTILSEASVIGIGSTNTAYMVSFGGPAVNAAMYLATSSGKFSPLVNNISSSVLAGAATPDTVFKTALAYRGGNTNGSAANGTLDSGAFATTTTGSLTTLAIGHRYYDSTRQLNGHIRRFQYWNRAFPDATLQRITQ